MKHTSHTLFKFKRKNFIYTDDVGLDAVNSFPKNNFMLSYELDVAKFVKVLSIMS